MSKSNEEQFSFTWRDLQNLSLLEISPDVQGGELQRYWIGLQPLESPGNVSIGILKVQTCQFQPFDVSLNQILSVEIVTFPGAPTSFIADSAFDSDLNHYL